MINHRSAIGKHSASYHWQANSEAAEAVLRQIEPYLVVKQVQARLALDTQERMRAAKRGDDKSWQQEAKAQMQALNRRGPV